MSLHLKVSAISGMSNCTFSSLVTLMHSHSLHSILCPAVRVTLENANLITSLPCLKIFSDSHASQEKSPQSACPQGPNQGLERPAPTPFSILVLGFLCPSPFLASLHPPICLLLSASGPLHLPSLSSVLPLLHWPITKLHQTAEMSFLWRNLLFTLLPLAVPYNIYHNHNYEHD